MSIIFSLLCVGANSLLEMYIFSLQIINNISDALAMSIVSNYVPYASLTFLYAKSNTYVYGNFSFLLMHNILSRFNKNIWTIIYKKLIYLSMIASQIILFKELPLCLTLKSLEEFVKCLTCTCKWPTQGILYVCAFKVLYMEINMNLLWWYACYGPLVVKRI